MQRIFIIADFQSLQTFETEEELAEIFIYCKFSEAHTYNSYLIHSFRIVFTAHKTDRSA